MSLYINGKNNTIVFTEKDFDINRNYLPDFFMAMGKLDKERPIKVALDLRKIPVLFVLYLKKVQDEGEVLLDIYYRDHSEAIRMALKGYGMQYRGIKEFQDPMPDDNFSSHKPVSVPENKES